MVRQAWKGLRPRAFHVPKRVDRAMRVAVPSGVREPRLLVLGSQGGQEGVPVVGALVARTGNEEGGGALHTARDAALHIGLDAAAVDVRRHLPREPLGGAARGRCTVEE